MLFKFSIVMPDPSALLVIRIGSILKDRRMCQASGLIRIFGFTLMFIAASPTTYICRLAFASLGAAFIINARSLVTFLVTLHQVDTLYSAFTMMQAHGWLVAGPLFARLFQLGLNFSRAWLGLPFLFAELLYAAATITEWFMSMPDKASDNECHARIAG